MNSPVLLVFLLAACCLLSEADEQNPVERLTDALAERTAKLKLEEYINLALGHNWDGEPAAVQEAANALKKLHPKEPCHFDNVDSIDTLDKLDRPVGELKIFRNEKPKLVYLLDAIKKDIEFECFLEAEEKWKKDAERTDRFENEFPELIYLSDILRVGVQFFMGESEIDDMNGVKELSKYSNSISNKLKGEIIRKVLRNINEFNGNKESLDSIDKKKAEKVIKEYLVEPCEKLLKQPEAITFFYPIFGWAKHVIVTYKVKRGRNQVGGPVPEFKSMFWATRWAFCNLLVQESYYQELAKRTVNRRPCLFSCFIAK